eukprot:TRINITY_DN12657_c0_g1_i1.p1 TRINITY_DN12657_c0_g1~~TRINITY_DN12657_c0_g1_i1.p1  ORF type:complete len:360 (-),score=67.11 TRINITY_DN12657_c0_g1_i1:131-1210(-)
MVAIEVKLVLFCFTAFPFCHLLSYFHEAMSNELLLFGFAVSTLVAFGFAAHVLIFRDVKSRSPFMYIFTVFAWTTTIDLVLAATIEGLITTMKYYLEEGEPYMQIASNALANWWDGIGHFVCYILMISALTRGTIARDASLYWFGSIINSLYVILVGTVSGSWGSTLHLSFLLNVPFLVLPFAYLVRVLSEPRPRARPTYRWQTTYAPWAEDVALAVLLILCAMLFVLRLLVVLRSPIPGVADWLSVEPFLTHPSLYPTLQAITWFAYGVPFTLLGATVLLCGYRMNGWLVDAAAAAAGAAAQGTITQFGSSLHHLMEPAYQSTQAIALLVNVGLVVAVHLFWLRCKRSWVVDSKVAVE